MAEKILQCCYSNIVSETGVTGWQVTAFSECVPAQLREKYARLQDANVTSQEPKDSRGNALKLYEIVVDGGYLYLTRVTYGLQDNRGRHNNMLSHSYLFELDDSVLLDPNVFLTIDDSNFTGDIEKAKQIPDSFIRSRTYTLEAAMESCGLDKDRYVQLIYAMYVQKESKRTIYIHSSRGESVIRPLVYCIWMGLPLSMRRSFSCASETVNMNSNKTITFSANHGSSEYFFDIDTGENNVLDQRTVKKYKRWGFADFFADNYEEIDGEKYFKTLEEIATKLGDSKAAKAKILKIAFQILTENQETELSFEDLQGKLFEALNAPVQPTRYMEEYICTILKKVNQSGRLLEAKVAEEALLNRLDQETIPELQEAGEKYMIRKITSVSVEEGVHMLSQLSEKQFDRFCDGLQQLENGPDYLDCYYEAHFPEQITWNTLNKFVDEICEHCEIYPRTKYKLDKVVKELYENELESDAPKMTLYNNYVDFAKTITKTNEEEAALPGVAKKLYWKHFTFQSFTYEDAKEYMFFYIEPNRICECVRSLLQVLAYIQKHNIQKLIAEMDSIWVGFNDLFSPEDCESIYVNLKQYVNINHMPNSENCVRMLYLMWKLRSTEFIDECQTYFNMLSQGKVQEFVDAYHTNISGVSVAIENEEVISAYNIFLFQYIKQKKGLDCVTIDVLLTVGKTMYENPFEIFEHIDLFSYEFLGLLSGEAEEIVNESILICEDEYIHFADEFVRGDSQYRQIIKEWLLEAKRQVKVQRRNERDNDVISSLGGFVGKIISKSDSEKEDDGSRPRKKKGGLFGRR